MKQEACNEIMDAMETMYRRMGCESYEKGMEMIQEAANRLEEFLDAAGSRRKMEALILESPEPSRTELLELTVLLKGFPYLLRKVLPNAIKELPHDPGGRRTVLTVEKSKDVCMRIGELMGKGAMLVDAQKRIAQKKDLSLRTIQRCWQKRIDTNSDDET